MENLKMTTTENQSKDINTWSVEQLVNKTTQLYVSSLKSSSKDVNMKAYQSILSEGENIEGLYPTLYDFLAFRALKYFKNSRYYLHKFNQDLQIKKKIAFADAQQFRTYPFIVRNSFKYQALFIYQKLLTFHKDNKYPKAQIHIDLERLHFMYREFNQEENKNGNEAYARALKKITLKKPQSEALYYLADYYATNENYKEAMTYAKKGQKSTDAYTANLCTAIKNNIEERSINIQMEEVNLANENILTYLSYKNIEKLFIKVIKPTQEQLELIEKRERLDDVNQNIEYVKSLQAIKTFNISLPKQNDYKEHRTEFSMGAYNSGEYLFLFSDDANFSKNSFFKRASISNIAYLKQKGKLLVLHRKSGEPLYGVEASFYKIIKNDKIFSFTTHSDKNGFITLPKDNNQYEILLNYYAENLKINIREYHYPKQKEYGEKRVHFFTDRTIYRPSQTLYFKGLAIESHKHKKPKILTNHKVSISFLNKNHQEIEVKTFVTDEYGTFHGEFTTPNTGLMGSMQLSANIGGVKYIHVEEYKRPKFEVTFKKLEKSYRLDDNVTVIGQAKAYAGNGIAKAKVKYRIQRHASFPWRNYWEHHSDNHKKQIKRGTVTTNDKGLFTINFEATRDNRLEKKQPNYHYTLHVDVTDSTGETHGNTKSIELGTLSIKAQMNIADELNVEDNKSVTLKTTNLDGKFQALLGEVVLEKLENTHTNYKHRYWQHRAKIEPIYAKEEFEKLFPTYSYLAKGNTQEKVFISSYHFNTQTNKVIKLGKLSQGNYLLTLKTSDEHGVKVSTTKKITVYDLNATTPHYNTLLWHKSDKKEYKVDSNAFINLKSSIKNLPVLLTIDRHKHKTKSQWIHINNLTQTLVKLKASDQGNIFYQLNFVRENRQYSKHGVIKVPWDNKLNIEYLSFRDKLKPNEKERWKIKISGQGKEKLMAQMVATMYDASLDSLSVHNFHLPKLFPTYYPNYSLRWSSHTFDSIWLPKKWKIKKLKLMERIYANLKWRNISREPKRRNHGGYASNTSYPVSALSVAKCGKGGDINPVTVFEEEGLSAKKLSLSNKSSKPIKIRKNLKETMFFKPNLQTDKEGNIIIDFKTNEALTRWNFIAFVHTKDLKTAVTKKTLTTSKELMVVTNLPRFFREKDSITLSAKVVNMSDKDLNGTCELKLIDPISEKPIFEREFRKSVSIKKGSSTVVEFKFTVPNVDEVSAIKHTIIAKTTTHSDAEQSIKPILSNRVFITESKNMSLKAHEEKTFTLESLKNNSSNTLKNHKLSLEFTSNPAWYAIKSLPYLMEYPHECNEQLFNRYFANALAAKIANASPKIKEVFESWKSKGELIATLETNSELKSVLLEETPWVLNAKSEAEQQANLGILFDLVRLAKEEKKTYSKLIKRQFEHSDGGWAWFESPHSNWYITQYIVEGFGKLKKLGIDKTNSEARGVAQCQ